MSISKIQAESMNLADTYAFTGTVTGAGEANDAVLIASASGGGTTSQQFNGCFTTDYKFYMICANITMNGDADVNMRFLDSSNNELSSGVHYYQGNRTNNNAGSRTNNTLGAFGGDKFGPNKQIQSSSTRFALYKIFVYDPFNSGTKTNYEFVFHCQAAASNLNTIYAAGVYDTAVSMTGFKFLSSNSNTIGSASKFAIYGFKQS